MKQIAVVSGKGGTGKTTLTGSLEHLFDNHLIADCDVDASNLHLLFEPKIQQTFEYFGGKKAIIDEDLCTGCGNCEPVCRFDSISKRDDGIYQVDPYACEGCKACLFACPVDAITLEENLAGHYFNAEVKNHPLIFAHLKPGEENSGGLVAEVRKQSADIAKEQQRGIVLIDGAPGVGCPATSSIVGVSYVVVVTEPTQSGFHDMERIIEAIDLYKIPFGIVVNKWDLNPDFSQKVKLFCEEKGYNYLGDIPFDPTVMKATMEGKPVIFYSDSNAAKAIKKIFNNIKKYITIDKK